ncbi:energy-coupling factor ABC transporter permease (plasmid) [Rhodococcus sp. ZPP]|uniref:energy-coupling factor ABC transporter permease n=1 Tax=Rhodococcus TaxID=1827 RepID=UPI001AD8896E|nr:MULTISPECIES: energy-coupling factor ABC transporter permease [Rhodococcus]MBO8150782.1 energy-coupling factor ABC transporter permease [Rhodococcus erythropolis]QTJ71013.1 energy-coupling factor ABC transporter permease [Rhodococcus sp. ZPP]
MHMSDGLVNARISLLFGVVAGLGIIFAGWKAREELTERSAPMAGLVAAFIFAVQMINFPILPGVSGHVLGGALAAILVGPYTGALCVAIVLLIQALLFADGGLTALGTNITNMALIGVTVGYIAAATLWAALRRSRAGGGVHERPTPSVQKKLDLQLGALAFASALIGTIAASLGFLMEYRMGGDGTGSIPAVAVYMISTHALIGIGEGVITALTIVSVAKTRPDLVYLCRATEPPVQAVHL